MRKPAAFLCMISLLSVAGLWGNPLMAQEEVPEAGASPAPSDQELQLAGERLFKGIADGDVSIVAQNTVMRLIRKMNPDKLRPPLTGPKVSPSFDGKVTVVRSSAKDAVIEAQVFKPETTDVPASEISRVRIYMVKEGGQWKAAAADKKEAMDDADLNGGWYHAAFFTFCPNKGLVFVPNHFSRDIKCQTVAQCARF
jgi:hypothetical protein